MILSSHLSLQNLTISITLVAIVTFLYIIWILFFSFSLFRNAYCEVSAKKTKKERHPFCCCCLTYVVMTCCHRYMYACIKIVIIIIYDCISKIFNGMDSTQKKKTNNNTRVKYYVRCVEYIPFIVVPPLPIIKLLAWLHFDTF